MQAVKTTCPYCGVGCGLDVQLQESGEITVQGDKDHPSNYGRLCSKGAALAETVDLSGRLLQPVMFGKKTDWDTALNQVADTFNRVIGQHGPDSIAFYVSGQLLTEDYYVANKLMKGFIGSGNIDTNSRLCMSSSVVGHKRAFGSDTVPGCYEDWEQCDLIILTGSNTAWCHPVLYQRLVQAKKLRPDLKIVVIDPRRTPTCEIADLHLAIKPGADAFLFTGLLNWLYSQGYDSPEYTSNYTEGLAAVLDNAKFYPSSIEIIADSCGLDSKDMQLFFEWFAHTEKTVTVYSQGINQSSSGSDKVNAIINCHLLTGRIGKPGMGPFSVTGQPNAMGGREVGALSNQLAAHMDYENKDDVERVSRFWSASRMSTKPGLKAVDLFKAIGKGKIKALWIMATNPAVSMPDSSQVRQALEQCEFVVVSDTNINTDTTQYADVLLPALAWGEKSGTVSNSERRISRQRRFLQIPGEARADWWIVSQVAQRMGFAGFDYQEPRQIFNEHARLSAYENNGCRDFNLSGLIDINDRDYEELVPIQWPVLKQGSGSQRFFDQGDFFTRSGKARFITVNPQLPVSKKNKTYPLVLNTGRVRDQWHTMTRTGKSPRLNNHTSEPYAQIHPSDADKKGIQHGQLVEVVSNHGHMIVRAELSEDQQAGSVFVPMHWNNQNSSNHGVDQLVDSVCDPYSGQPEFKYTPVSISPFKAIWYGFALSRTELSLDSKIYWVRSWKDGFWHYELAGDGLVDNWAQYSRSVFNRDNNNDTWSELLDSTEKSYRAARFENDRLEACIFFSDHYLLPSRDWLFSLFSKEFIERSERLRILSAKPGTDREGSGKIICSCFNVGKNKLCESIKKYGLTTSDQVGDKLQAGTNCGSCVPEINTLIKSVNI